MDTCQVILPTNKTANAIYECISVYIASLVWTLLVMSQQNLLNFFKRTDSYELPSQWTSEPLPPRAEKRPDSDEEEHFYGFDPAEVQSQISDDLDCEPDEVSDVSESESAKLGF